MIHTKLIVGGTNQDRQTIINQIVQKNLGICLPKPHPDLLVIGGDNSIGIDQIRNLKAELALKPYQASVKIAIITEAEKLTLPAQSALLKTLEEPAGNTLIILGCSNPNLLLPTILSRSQLIKLSLKIEKYPSRDDLPSLSTMRAGERLKIAVCYAKDRYQAIDFIKVFLFSTREQLIQNPSLKLADKARKIQQALLMLQANTNPVLTLGNLFLRLS